MLFLVGNVGEPIGYVFCVFPLVEFCLRPDFRVDLLRKHEVHTPQLTESPQEQAKKYHLV